MIISTISTLLSGGQVSFSSVVAEALSIVFIIFCILPLHEFAHGWVANKLGDPTAKLDGRLTLNPLASIDPMGALALLLFGFGWAKPVPVDSRYFKKPKRDVAITALAGPVSNLLASLVGAFVYAVLLIYVPYNAVAGFLLTMLGFYVSVNISLAVFNLIPIPPLDGSRIVGAFLSDRALSMYYRYQNYLVMALFLLMFTGALSGPLGTVQSFFGRIIMNVAFFPFRLAGAL